MDTVTIKVSLSFDSPIEPHQLNQLQDKFYELVDAEVNDGELAVEGAEVVDFEIDVERSDE